MGNPQNLPSVTKSVKPLTASVTNFEALATKLDRDHHTVLGRLQVSVDECRALLTLHEPEKCSSIQSVNCAEMLMKAMPFGEGTDKDIWLRDMVIVFAEYPRRDVEMLMHPLKGIRSKQKWLPVVSEVIEFLDAQRNRRARILHNAKGVVDAADAVSTEVEISPEERAAVAERMAVLAAKLKATPIEEPVAGRSPVDHKAIASRRRVLAEIEDRKSQRTIEEMAEHERVKSLLLNRRTA